MRQKQWLLLSLWLLIGTALRLTQLEAKPPWTDEFSTIVFSLGNSFRSVPLDRAIALDTLLQPIQPNQNAGVSDVLQHLFSETNHPPLYFVLSHWWMRLFPPGFGDLASVWAARSLSVLFGSLSIPAIYGLTWLAFRSTLVSQLTAAIMAVSPYGVFIAQEARHYTLGILWVIASVSCLLIATKRIQRLIPIPNWLIVIWICINALGVSTHYFFALTLGTEALWLIVLAFSQFRGKLRANANPKQYLNYLPWWQILVAAIGTIIACLVWVPLFFQANRGGELTNWIQIGNDDGFLKLFSPLLQALGIWISMLYLLPVSVSSLVVVIGSGLIMLFFFIWLFPILKRGIVTQIKQPATRLMTQMFGVLVLGAIALFFFFTYALDIDLTRGARYYFVYFPSIIVLLGTSLAVCWKTPTIKQKFFSFSGKTSVAIILSMGLISGLCVVSNLGYPKYYRPDLLVPVMQKVSHSPMLIATTHKTHVQTGEMMGLARVFKLSGSATTPLFLLAHQDQDSNTSTTTLKETLAKLPRPLDVWLVNFHAPVELNGCVVETHSFPLVNGYDYQIHHCS
ncbi:glycosyltransferase [Aetokthonos hydrillicola Thurmond2011]|uniref:Glycosyltransferase n=1 Tax=Aetokthonos hydrillicola Thurmond2011 TaxID=2712845 RepID=A0AAP5M9D9_9CYAN|nr:glycosyltransferase [Aetokthonos hydrillicola]MBO3457766.1 glycosyltransferase [Aetokthonos hydrillicola CCALA 1050]MBW4589383.1 glycosyltransferase [Aetokthonos hydrillicola CCALA 1050]MDR9897140.1 glycosyltransferase [Aetokthonos hydrillicola Thurmond2011]